MENCLRLKKYQNLVACSRVISTFPVGASQEKLQILDDGKLKDLKVKIIYFKLQIEASWKLSYTAKVIWDPMKHKYQGSMKVKRA